MKKRTLSIFLVLCMMFGLLPAALASENGGDAGSNAIYMEISGNQRTETGLQCQATLHGFQHGDLFWAVVFEEADGLPGQMKQFLPLSMAENPVLVELTNVSDTDFVRLIWTDKDFAVRDYKTIARPADDNDAASGVKEVDGDDFDAQVMSLLHPGFLSAAAEMELEEAAEKDPYAYKRLIVSSDEKLPNLSAYGDPYVIYNPSTGYSILQFADANDAKTCAAFLSDLPSVHYVEPDILLKSGPKSSEDFLNSDSDDFLSWGVKQMKADVLAAALKNKSGTSPVVVAVADTGAQMDHPFLKDYLTDNGFDFIENDDTPQDQHSHGTHVAGTIVDCTRGLNIKIMPVRVLGASGGGTAAGIAMGIRYAVKNGAKVVNMSLGGGHSNYLDDAIQEALDSGVTVVVAAGNEGNNVMDHCPAHIIDAITVGAVDSSWKKASFSNYGDSLDIVAPGVGIESSILKGQYGQKNGTSMASPHVAAAAAMLKYGFPDKTPAEIQQALKDTAIDLGDAGWDKDYGYGFPNLEKFVDEWPESSDNPDPLKHEYMLFETGKVWADAKTYCEQIGGHLMTVTSAEEQAILEELLQDGGKNSYWLGATRDTSGLAPDSAGGNFKWVTNEEFSYTNWAPTQPDYGDNIEDSLMVYRNLDSEFTGAAKFGEWNDLSHDGTWRNQAFFGLDNFGFICEWEGAKPDPLPDPDKPANPGIFAFLYADGELVFQNNDKARQNKEVLEYYPVDGAILQSGGSIRVDYANGESEELFDVDYADWYSNRKQITKVTILDKIQPTSTALWFHGCENLESITGLEYLDTSAVTNMSHMFSECYKLTDLNLSSFDTSGVTNMSHMFYDCDNLVNLDLTSFDTSAVTDMGNMFSGCTALNRIYATEAFVVAAVTNSMRMFRDCKSIEGTFGTKYDKDHIDKEYARLDDNNIPPVAPGYFTDKRVDPGKANVYIYSDGEMVFQRLAKPDANRTVIASYVIDMLDRQNYTGVQALWYEHREKVNLVTFADLIRPFATSQWFYGFKNLTEIRNIKNLDTRAVTDMSYMFAGCSALASLDVSGFNTRKVTNMSNMFADCAALTALDISAFVTDKVTDMSAMFADCAGLTALDVTALNTANVTNMNNMFRDCVALAALDLSSFDTAKLTDMNYMFRNCKSMTTLDVSRFNTSKVTDMKYLFSGCESLTALDLSSFNTGNVADMQSMFSGCAALASLDVGGFDTRNVANMSAMFRGTATLASLNVSSFNTSKVTDMSGMFAETALTALDLHTFDTSSVTTMNGMFQSSSALATLDLTDKEDTVWNTARVADMENMFRNCSALTTVNVAVNTFPTNAVTNDANMFANAVSIVGGRGTTYDAAHIDKEYARIDFGRRSPGYFTDPNMVILTFDPNGDDEDPVSGTMEEQPFSKGVEEKLDPNQFTREGYDFKGWNTKADGSGKSYQDGDNITLLSDLTLYAQWDYSFMENLYAILYSDGELVFQWNETPAAGRSVVATYVTDRHGYGDNRDSQDNYRAWHNEADQIKVVTFAKHIQPDDTAQWFQDCSNLTEVRNLQKLDTSLVVDMSMMFEGCANLKKLDLHTFDTANVGTDMEGDFEAMFNDCYNLESVDLSSFDTKNASSMKDMFRYCENLKTIYASDKFVTAQVTGSDGRNMFGDCWKLVGGAGTAFDEDHTNVEYAHIDGGASNPGYFTDKDIGSLMP